MKFIRFTIGLHHKCKRVGGVFEYEDNGWHFKRKQFNLKKQRI